MIYKDDDVVKFYLVLKGNIFVLCVFKDLNCFYSCVYFLSSGCFFFGMCFGVFNLKMWVFLECVFRLNCCW